MCDAAMEKIHLFYTEDFINYLGRYTDTDELCSEVIAQYISEHIDNFIDGIKSITSKSSCKIESHLGGYNPNNSRRAEEITTMKMFNFFKDGGRYDYIGKIIDYQTPLKNISSDEAGKIDLLAYDGTCLQLLELKKTVTKKTMSRSLMEGFTYLETVDQKKLLQNFNLPPDTKIVACPFVFAGGKSNPYQEMQEERPQLRRFKDLLNNKPYDIMLDEIDDYFDSQFLTRRSVRPWLRTLHQREHPLRRVFFFLQKNEKQT